MKATSAATRHREVTPRAGKWKQRTIATVAGLTYLIAWKALPEKLPLTELVGLSIGWLGCFIGDFGPFVKRQAPGVWTGTAIYLTLHTLILYVMWRAMPLPPISIFPVLIVEHLAGMIIMAGCVGEEII